MYLVAAAWVETVASPEMRTASASAVNIFVFIMNYSLRVD